MGLEKKKKKKKREILLRSFVRSFISIYTLNNKGFGVCVCVGL